MVSENDVNEDLKAIEEVVDFPSPELSSSESFKYLTSPDQYHEQIIKDMEQKRDLRQKSASRVFYLVCCWLACVVAAVFCQGFDFIPFKISDKILVIFITTTTVSILGLYIIVAKWLFPNNDKDA
ncbi:MAG: hypothetical protein ERJ69_03630 [Aphanocapsa feldmannii 288cV]|nr:MAG: hypothetical protein ERJ69_03630 [Aphanocapsa feldmannii 288cV]